jgi:hypothetical protein
MIYFYGHVDGVGVYANTDTMMFEVYNGGDKVLGKGITPKKAVENFEKNQKESAGK